LGDVDTREGPLAQLVAHAETEQVVADGRQRPPRAALGRGPDRLEQVVIANQRAEGVARLRRAAGLDGEAVIPAGPATALILFEVAASSSWDSLSHSSELSMMSVMKNRSSPRRRIRLSRAEKRPVSSSSPAPETTLRGAGDDVVESTMPSVGRESRTV